MNERRSTRYKNRRSPSTEFSDGMVGCSLRGRLGGIEALRGAQRDI